MLRVSRFHASRFKVPCFAFHDCFKVIARRNDEATMLRDSGFNVSRLRVKGFVITSSKVKFFSFTLSPHGVWGYTYPQSSNSTIHHPPSSIQHLPSTSAIQHPTSNIYLQHPPSAIRHPPSTFNIHHPPSTSAIRYPPSNIRLRPSPLTPSISSETRG
jgi:hypothetical protein